jgi:hypothetical protein
MALLTDLRFFQLNGFNVGGTLEGMFAGPNIQTVVVNLTSLVGPLPRDLFANNPGLRSVDVSHSKLSGPLPGNLWSVVGLESLTLNFNAFSGPLEDHLNFNRSASYPANLSTLAEDSLPRWRKTHPFLLTLASSMPQRDFRCRGTR